MDAEGSGVRRAVAVLLALIAGISLVVGAVSLAARQTLFDPRSVQDVSSRLLEEPAVRSAIADRLTTRLQTLVPALRDPVLVDRLEQLAEQLLTSSDQLRRTFADAMRRLQLDLLRNGALRVELRLEGMLAALMEGLVQLGAPLQLSEGEPTGVLEVDPDQVQTYRRLNDVTRQAGWPSIAIGALGAAGAALVAERRRRAILGTGVTVAALALVALGGLVLARSAAAGQGETPEAQDAVGAVWDVVARDIRSVLALVLLAGLGTAVAGLALQAFRGGRASG